MIKTEVNVENNSIKLNGKGLFSKDEVTVSIHKGKPSSGIVFFVLKDGKKEKIEAKISNISNAVRNTVLSNGSESLCLIEHFLSSCSILGINDIEVHTNKNELIIGDGSAIHWKEAFDKMGYKLVSIKEKYNLEKPIFVKKDKKEIIAIPHNGFQVSYCMDWSHPALGKLFASWKSGDDPETLLEARTFGTKQENDYFEISDRILTLDENGFNMELRNPLEPVYHKILDIIGDLSLGGLNPLEINMHVIGFKSGHELNVELAKELSSASLVQTV